MVRLGDRVSALVVRARSETAGIDSHAYGNATELHWRLASSLSGVNPQAYESMVEKVRHQEVFGSPGDSQVRLVHSSILLLFDATDRRSNNSLARQHPLEQFEGKQTPTANTDFQRDVIQAHMQISRAIKDTEALQLLYTGLLDFCDIPISATAEDATQSQLTSHLGTASPMVKRALLQNTSFDLVS
ncbi:MAG: hypothetical protein Q9170_006795 [Blastenia crenularia]